MLKLASNYGIEFFALSRSKVTLLMYGGQGTVSMEIAVFRFRVSTTQSMSYIWPHGQLRLMIDGYVIGPLSDQFT